MTRFSQLALQPPPAFSSSGWIPQIPGAQKDRSLAMAEATSLCVGTATGIVSTGEVSEAA